MSVAFSFNLLPSLLPGEKVLFFKRWVWGLSAKSPPSYRIFWSAPPLWEAGLYVTERRLLLVVHLFRLLTQQVSLWLDGQHQPGGHECVEDVSVGRSRLFGPYLEVVSENPTKEWFRSPRCRSRFFMRDPESLRRIIAEARSPSASGIGVR